MSGCKLISVIRKTQGFSNINIENYKIFYLMILVAAIAMWNMGVAYIAGVILNEFMRRGWVKI